MPIMTSPRTNKMLLLSNPNMLLFIKSSIINSPPELPMSSFHYCVNDNHQTVHHCKQHNFVSTSSVRSPCVACKASTFPFQQFGLPKHITCESFSDSFCIAGKESAFMSYLSDKD